MKLKMGQSVEHLAEFEMVSNIGIYMMIEEGVVLILSI